MAQTFPVSLGPDETENAGRPREWGALDLVLLPVAAIVLFVVVFWAALGEPPLGGTTIVDVLGYAFVALTNLSLGALVSGTVIEIRHPDWSRLRGADHAFVYIALVVVAAVDAGAAWWVFTSDTGGSARWFFLGSALAGLAVGALWAWPGLLTRTFRPATRCPPR
jgi:hypothetical protein